jgi:hypothetical protein
MRAILIHGMGRTPVAMLGLATRLRAAGMAPRLFAYSAAIERWEGCLNRLERYIKKTAETEQYILVGHSLGSVLIRGVLPRLPHKPIACFFLAPPTKACLAARKFAPRLIYKMFTGEMGQLLADATFMEALPLPDVPTKIYAGINGPRGRYSPFGEECNDGILALHETVLPDALHQQVPSLHTFIMNKHEVARDIVRFTHSLYRSGFGTS